MFAGGKQDLAEDLFGFRDVVGMRGFLEGSFCFFLVFGPVGFIEVDEDFVVGFDGVEFGVDCNEDW